MIILPIIKEVLLVFIYFKEFLATPQVGLNNLSECIVFGVCIPNKRGHIISLYRSSSRTHDKFCDFLLNSEKVLVVLMLEIDVMLS